MSGGKEPRKPADEKKKLVILRSGASEAGDAELAACGETLEQALSKALSGRDHVVMVRVSREILDTLDMLVESGICDSRSSAAAFVLSEGIQANAAFFESVADTVGKMRELKEDLKRKARPAGGKETSTEEDG
jgi:hypothetical protein